jgi:Bacterial Ig-like domain (group 3)
VTKRSTSVLAGLTAATVAASASLVLAVGGPADAATPPPWQSGAAKDPNATGVLTLHDASGAEIHSGTLDDGPIADFVSGSATLRTGDESATLFAYTPDSAAPVGAWTGLQLSATTDFADATLPTALDNGHPVVALTAADTTIPQYAAGFPNTSTATGYHGVYELRLRTTSPGHSATAAYDVVDIEVQGSTWRVAGVGGESTTTSLVVTPTSPKVGDTATLSAAVTPGAAGSVQFRDGATALGSPVAVTGGAASTTTLVTNAGAHTYSAVFTPTDTDAYSGSTGTSAVTVAKAASTVTVTWPRSATYGVASTVRVRVAASSGSPTGTVKVTEGAVTLGTATLSAGVATLRIAATALKPGAHTLKATYAGTADIAAGSSTAGTLKVAKATARASNRLAAAKIKARAKGKLTVTVTSTGVVPTGTVTVFDGRKKIATGTLRNGKVVIALPRLRKGTHKIHAVYAGSTLVAPAAAANATLKVTR